MYNLTSDIKQGKISEALHELNQSSGLVFNQEAYDQLTDEQWKQACELISNSSVDSLHLDKFILMKFSQQRVSNPRAPTEFNFVGLILYYFCLILLSLLIKDNTLTRVQKESRFSSFCKMLKKGLKELYLYEKSVFGVDSQTWKLFCDTLQESQITMFHLEKNDLSNLTEIQWEAFCCLLIKSHITTLILRNTNINQLTDDQWALFCLSLTRLELLDLSNNELFRLTPLRWRMLSVALAKSNIKKINLNGNQLSLLNSNQWEAFNFNDSLSDNRSTVVDLSNNGFESVSGVACLSGLIKKQLTWPLIVFSLDLSHHKLTNNFIENVLRPLLLTSLISFDKINLSGNELTLTSLSCLLDLFSSHGWENIRVLDLSCNYIEITGVLQVELINLKLKGIKPFHMFLETTHIDLTGNMIYPSIHDKLTRDYIIKSRKVDSVQAVLSQTQNLTSLKGMVYLIVKKKTRHTRLVYEWLTDHGQRFICVAHLTVGGKTTGMPFFNHGRIIIDFEADPPLKIKTQSLNEEHYIIAGLEVAKDLLEKMHKVIQDEKEQGVASHFKWLIISTTSQPANPDADEKRVQNCFKWATDHMRDDLGINLNIAFYNPVTVVKTLRDNPSGLLSRGSKLAPKRL